MAEFAQAIASMNNMANNNQSSRFAEHADFTVERLDEILDIIDDMSR